MTYENVRLTPAGEKYRELLREASTPDRVAEIWPLVLHDRREGNLSMLDVQVLQEERDAALVRLAPPPVEA